MFFKSFKNVLRLPKTLDEIQYRFKIEILKQT